MQKKSWHIQRCTTARRTSCLDTQVVLLQFYPALDILDLEARACAGADEFRKNKIIHRADAKRKSWDSQPKRQKCNSMTDILLGAKRKETGRPTSTIETS